MSLSHTLPSGKVLSLEGALDKLALRARLPGASLYDRATHALRRARAAGLPLGPRLDLALASSWLVNSPATSPRLRALATEPHAERLVALAERLERFASTPTDDDAREVGAQVDGVAEALGPDRPRGCEILSKLLALVVPEAVPLLPDPACVFLLGAPPDAPGARFAEAAGAFRAAVDTLYPGLVEIARAHEAAVLDAAQVLDRLVWFDSEGHRHFTPAA